MTLSRFFNVSLRCRSWIAIRLAPSLLPTSQGIWCHFEQAGMARQFPEKVFVTWLFWQLRIGLKIKNIAKKT